MSIKNQIPLHWIGNNTLPRRCNYPGSLEAGEEYKDVLPFLYIGDLFQAGYRYTDLPKDTGNELLFLFTFEQGEYLYIISSLDGGIIEDSIPYLSLSFNNEYQIQIRFKSNEHSDSDGKMFRLNATSWENVTLTEL
jgi:hypothetical protein